MARRIDLLRHGETDCTRAGVFCGRHDPSMNPAGIATIQAIVERSGSDRWSAVYSSPLRRARESAAIAADRMGLPVYEHDGLIELDYGRWDGLGKPDVEISRAYRRWLGNPDQFAPPGGETARQVATRAVAALKEIGRAHSGDPVLVVSHKAVIRILICHYLGIDMSAFRDRIEIPVGSLTTLEFGLRGPMLCRLGESAMPSRANTLIGSAVSNVSQP